MVFKENLVVAVMCNGQFLRELGSSNVVHLPFGSEYSLLFKNKSGKRAVVSVGIDGQDVTKHGRLVVDANSEYVLEGFINANNGVDGKFRFIQKTEEIKKYRGDRVDDGIITVQWQFETPLPEIQKTIHINEYLPYRKPYGPLPQFPSPWSDNPIYGSPGTGHPNKKYTSTGPMHTNVLRSYGGVSGQSVGNGVSSASIDQSVAMDSNTEEGITVVGSDSQQSFVNVSTRELEKEVHSISIWLRGMGVNDNLSRPLMVTKPLFAKTKVQCPTCGRKNKSSCKFCGNCGTKLIIR